jgi:hypothetical protein
MIDAMVTRRRKTTNGRSTTPAEKTRTMGKGVQPAEDELLEWLDARVLQTLGPEIFSAVRPT